MDKARFSKKPKKVPARSLDDIPEALRDNRKVTQRRRSKSVTIVGGFIGLGVIGAFALLWFLTNSPPGKVSQSSVTTPTASPTTSDRPSNENVLLGHFAYPEASPKDLQPISRDRQIKLRKAAAQQFRAMSASARASGVTIVPISGFRTVKDQQHLFFDVKAQRGQTATKRAEVSAPPGYSEHHTGYAVDIGDGTPATNLSTKFETTRAYKWLSANAARYSFELSFAKNNRQGVSYEPWHWRYVGNRDSLETFYKAQNLKSRPNP
ncbi:M15 family metallopeptidase [Synechocystis sp. PCC 7509]|uniref:M15 family metallopeptidase n=1 Tax=Synechocystis sp. PCC 7509 TaxID=927677 RepID=UPI0002AC4861|nr:M15 family metallopeptidase [Synechocystis sp. PCC 7509]